MTGGEELEGCTPHLQRYRWHLGHRKHYLLQDVPHGFRGHFQETITQIVIDRSLGQQHFRRCQFNLVAIDLKTAAGHLENAAKEPFAYIDTSPQ
jgi:hypothetical protein